MLHHDWARSDCFPRYTSLGQASCPDLYVGSRRQHLGLYQNAPERRNELHVQERKSVRLVCYGFHY